MKEVICPAINVNAYFCNSSCRCRATNNSVWTAENSFSFQKQCYVTSVSMKNGFNFFLIYITVLWDWYHFQNAGLKLRVTNWLFPNDLAGKGKIRIQAPCLATLDVWARFSHLVAVWPWANNLTSVCLSFFICEGTVIITVASSRGCGNQVGIYEAFVTVPGPW